jgi:hypothetical protein
MVSISKEATLLALRICYGELVDSDTIGWLISLKCSPDLLRMLLSEIYTVSFGFEDSLKKGVETLSRHLDYFTS